MRPAENRRAFGFFDILIIIAELKKGDCRR